MSNILIPIVFSFFNEHRELGISFFSIVSIFLYFQTKNYKSSITRKHNKGTVLVFYKLKKMPLLFEVFKFKIRRIKSRL